MLKNNNYWLIGQKEIADYLQVSTNTVRKYCKKENAPFVYFGGQYRAHPEKLDEWMSKLKR